MRSATTSSKCRRRRGGSGKRCNCSRQQSKEAIMYETTYHRAASVDEATALLARNPDAKFLAGGHTLLPVMKQRLAGPSDVIDIARIKDLIGIEVTSDALIIKAATTYYDITQSAEAKRAIPAIVHLTSVLGDP